jgi:hypothetical protein
MRGGRGGGGVSNSSVIGSQNPYHPYHNIHREGRNPLTNDFDPLGKNLLSLLNQQRQPTTTIYL